ncbi:DNA replication protein psf1 [Mitosporidium daphniae]|uniref:DNA replication complex GINS protein PSF1 n=1 Tax=Mitosporidium daphniae TaxID=1485682 RepID=A0A098VMZ5_9MICR|nr:uncharacterized protein DI09_6p210 [Mitosporidium daphniae]KGG50437.1 hypothetical protein DI09_6p210 [Mitosporidium daphniae]|eukprot:XP_013236864.1 uncharacterized protein DI09_6p210 [Mitosporidium daphniae]
MSNAALCLLKEARCSSYLDSQFNYKSLSIALSDMADLFSKAQGIVMKSTMGDQDESMGESERNLLLIYHTTILRIQRILTASLVKHMQQLMGLSKHYTPADSKEVELIKSYENSLGTIKGLFPSLDLFVQGCSITDGPRKLFSLVRVVEDCGVIQTERGFLTLDADTLHFVRADDVRHLMLQRKLVFVD